MTDKADLEAFGTDGGAVLSSRGWDGDAIATTTILLTGGSLHLIRIWLRARVDQRKNSTVIIEGRRMSGYTADEVVKIMSALDAVANPGEETIETSEIDI